jgi:hypothetical protein
VTPKRADPGPSTRPGPGKITTNCPDLHRSSEVSQRVVILAPGVPPTVEQERTWLEGVRPATDPGRIKSRTS